jgi:hypothetical protein
MVRLYLAVLAVLGPARTRLARCRGDAGQTTAEYALVLLGAAGVALLVVAWATSTDSVGRLLDGVLDEIISNLG